MMKPLYYIILSTILFAIQGCKKDGKFNPACKEEKLSPAYIYGSSCEYGMVRLIDENGDIMHQNGWSGQVRWKDLPKEYRLSEGDSLLVSMNYKIKVPNGCFLDADPCTPCTTYVIKCVKIKI